MNYVGIDIGSTASKVVVRGDNEMYFVLPTGWSSKETTNIIRERLKNAGVDVTAQETKVVATGYGRVAVDFADKVITEITCHARGGRELASGDCTIIDVGGQDTKVIQVSNGVVMDFLMNDKCSAGTGKFLEVMTNRLGLTQRELSELASKGEGVTISSMCTVFAESEVISLIGQGEKKENIAFAVVDSIVRKVAAQANRMSEDRPMLCLTGGLCECSYISEALTKELGMEVKTDPQSRYAGAIGAALGAVKKGKKN